MKLEPFLASPHNILLKSFPFVSPLPQLSPFGIASKTLPMELMLKQMNWSQPTPILAIVDVNFMWALQEHGKEGLDIHNIN